MIGVRNREVEIASMSALRDAGIGAGGVDQRDHGQRETLGELHQPHRLAVALGLGHAEVAQHLLRHAASLLLADDHDRDTVEARHAADDRVVVGEMAVTV